MRSIILFSLVALLAVSAGCWMSGPWVGADSIREDFNEDIQLGMLRSEVEEVLGKPTEVVYEVDQDGRTINGSEAAWLIFKFDYPADPLLIGVRVDYFGVVVEKRLDDRATQAAKAAETEGEFDYPGAPMPRFQELERRQRYGEGL